MNPLFWWWVGSTIALCVGGLLYMAWAMCEWRVR